MELMILVTAGATANTCVPIYVRRDIQTVVVLG